MRWGLVVTTVFHMAVSLALAVSWFPARDSARFAGHPSIELTIAMPQLIEHVPPTRIEFEPQLSSNEVVISPTRAVVAKSHFVLAAHDTQRPTPKPLLSPPTTQAMTQKRETSTVATHERPSALRPRRRIREPQPGISTQVSIPKSLGNNHKTPPDFSRNRAPTYPAIAVERGWEGVVWLRVEIDAQGFVTRVTVIKSSGHRVLDGAAATAVKSWKARPAMRGSRPVQTTEVLPVRFRR